MMLTPVSEAWTSKFQILLEISLTRRYLPRYFVTCLLRTIEIHTQIESDLKPPRGILVHGPPETGKTPLARIIAGSTKSPVTVVNGPELPSAYHGETEPKLRVVYKEASKSPCIALLDESRCPGSATRRR
ncbi:hypothetical protein F5051DRAFT_64246 [Lentinula edodes]|nr:hypothetical protein F5051DRAFT_64246 [Lentinula edodes]